MKLVISLAVVTILIVGGSVKIYRDFRLENEKHAIFVETQKPQFVSVQQERLWSLYGKYHALDQRPKDDTVRQEQVKLINDMTGIAVTLLPDQVPIAIRTFLINSGVRLR